MSSSQGSFSIKSSHKFINPVVKEEEDIEKETNFFFTSKLSSKIIQETMNLSETQNTDRKEGSNTGLAIRSTYSSLEDFY